MSALESDQPEGAGAAGALRPGEVERPDGLLAEERAEIVTKRRATDLIYGGALRDIAMSHGYGVLSKDEANAASKKLLKEAGLLDGDV